MSRPPEREHFMLDGPSGRLECLLEVPSTMQHGQPARVAVCCHPHPLHGGAMTNKVVHTLARAAVDCGMASLRFNFRGVGSSDGSYDDGRGEVDDALAVIAEARRRYAGDWVLGGFSFGSVVAMRAAERQLPSLLLSIAPPVERLPPDWQPPDCPWLVVQGDQDELIDSAAVAAWAEALPVSPELIVMPGVSHFFHGRLTELRQKLAARIDRI